MKTIQTSKQTELNQKKKDEMYNKAHINCNRCPSCKSSNYYKWSVPALSILGFLTGTEYLKDVYECKICKGIWESGKYLK